MIGLAFALLGCAATLVIIALMGVVTFRALVRAMTGSHRTYTYRPDGSVQDDGE